MEGRLTIDTPQEYLSGFEKKTAMLGRYKTTTDVNKAELYEELKHIIPGLTTSELDVYSEVIKYDPKQMKDFLKSIGKSPVLTKYLVNIRKPLNKEENEEWEDNYINREAMELIENRSMQEQAREEVDNILTALGQGAENNATVGLLGAESIFRGVFRGGTRSDATLQYQAALIAKNAEIEKYLKEISPSKAESYKLALGVGGMLPAVTLVLAGQVFGVAGYVEAAKVAGTATMTALGTQSFASAFEPGTDLFAYEGVKNILQGTMNVVALKSGLTAAKSTMGMNLGKAFMIDSAINLGVDIAQITMDMALEDELQYDPVDLLGSSFVSNAFFFGLGRAGGALKSKRLEKIVTNPEYAKKVLRGETAEKSSQRIKLLMLDILSETDVPTQDKIRVMNRALKSGLVNTKDSGEIVGLYATLKNAGKFQEFKSKWADRALIKKAEKTTKEMELRNIEEPLIDETKTLRELESEEVDYAKEVREGVEGIDRARPEETEMVEGAEGQVRVRSDAETRLEAETKKVESKKYSEAETVKQAVDRMEIEGKTDRQIKAAMKKAGVEIKDVEEYRQAKMEFDAELKIGAEIPKDVFSTNKTRAEQDQIAKNMTPKDAQELSDLKQDADDYLGTIGAAKAGFSSVPIKQLRENMIKFITKNTSLNTRGKLLKAVTDAKTSGEIGEVMRRAMELEEAFQKRLNIVKFKMLKKKATKANKAGHVPAKHWAAIENILNMFDPVKMSTEQRNKLEGQLDGVRKDLENNPEVEGLLTNEQLSNLKRLGKKPLADMSPREVAEITEDLQALFVASRNAYTTMWHGKRIAKDKLFDEVRQEMLKSTKVSKFTKSLMNSKFWSSHWHNDVFAMMTGSKIFKQIFDTNITAGNRRMYEIQFKAQDMWERSTVAKRFKQAIFGVYDPTYVQVKVGGSSHKLTESEMLKIYMLSKDAYGLRHLIGADDSGLEIDGKIVKITPSEIKSIQKTVESSEEYSKAINKLKEVQEYVWTEMNETYMRDTGRQLDRREFYTMMEVSSQLLSGQEIKQMTPKGGDTSFGRTMGANMSVIRKLTRSTKALKLDGIFSSARKSIERSSKYTAMREPTKLAYSFILDANNAQLIKTEYGEQVYRRMLQSIEDEMGVRYNPDELNSFLNRVLGNIAVATLAFNVFSNLKTRTSIMAALVYVENKYKIANIASKSEIRKDALLRLRADGKISPEISMARDVRYGSGKFGAKLQKITHEGMKVIAEGDEWVVRKIYGMMKAKVEAENPDLQGEEKQRKISEMTYEIVRKSQPTFLTHDRPYSRRGNALWRAIMPFSSQRIQNVNLLMRGLIEYEQGGKTFESAKRLNSVIAYTWIAQAMLGALINELRREVMGYKKKEDSTYVNRILKGTYTTMMGNVPLGGDILVDMIDRVAGEYTYGDSIENIVFQQFNAISVQGPAAISNWIKASTKGMSQKERDIYNERANKNAIRALKSASRVTGLPKVGFDLYEIVKKYTQKNK